MKYDVFISYSSKDQKIAEGICGYMERNGIRCFVAYRDIPVGVSYADIIPDAIHSSKIMVAIFSKHFNLSRHVTRELELISKDNKPILTFRLSDVQMTGAKEYFLSDLNWIDAFPDPDSFFGVLLKNAKSILGLNNSNTNHTSKGSHSNKETITYDNGTYEGSIINGVRSGFGIYTWNERSQWSGDRYEGNWRDDKIDGKGTLYYSNGNKFEGNWKNGVRSGFGIYTWNDGSQWNGDRYEGNWTDDKIDGKGTYYFSNGNKFEGNWKNGVRSGFGTTYYKDGTIEDGYWENDKYIGKNKPKGS